MSKNYRALMSMTDDELVTAHDEKAVHTEVGVDYYLEELRRRAQDRTNRLVLHLTFANTALAAAAVIVAVVALFR